ncbi:MAG TPA: hypothetical protein DCY97_00130 [Marinilabiliales bacterium]|nr:hypothetical protein [Marinilabiliales bacterium]
MTRVADFRTFRTASGCRVKCERESCQATSNPHGVPLLIIGWLVTIIKSVPDFQSPSFECNGNEEEGWKQQGKQSQFCINYPLPASPKTGEEFGLAEH